MTLAQRKKVMDVAAARVQADLVITNVQVVDLYNATIRNTNVAIAEGVIAGVGEYHSLNQYDAQGGFLIPGLIDSHVHIESAHIDPPSFSELVLPHGTTTIIADPHEICNVNGIAALDYMIESSKDLPLSIFYMIPSCVPSTRFEHSGAILDAAAIASRIDSPVVLGLGEMMDMEATVAAEPFILEKLQVAHDSHKIIDGHGPSLTSFDLQTFVASGILTDHECTTVEELEERIASGMYVLLREGSASHDLRTLLKGITKENSRRALFCTDDRQPKSILEEGHIDNHLRIAVEEGLDPITAIRMATLNAAECYRLYDRGAIAAGKRADLVVVKDLKEFEVVDVFSKGVLFKAQKKANPRAIPVEISTKIDIGKFNLKDLELPLKSDDVRVIEIEVGSLVTHQKRAKVRRDSNGLFQYDPTQDIAKIATIERHNATQNVGLALISGFNIKGGAIATTIAHDSHNIIVIGDNDLDMFLAVESLKEIKGGIVVVHNKAVISSLSLPIAGLMTNMGAHYVSERLEEMHKQALEILQINKEIDPFTTLSFMALPVIPHLKVTDMGLFDVDTYQFVSVEA